MIELEFPFREPLLKALSSTSESVLVMGCLQPSVGLLLASRGHSTTIYDTNEAAVEHGFLQAEKLELDVTFVCNSELELPLKSYDVIVDNSYLERMIYDEDRAWVLGQWRDLAPKQITVFTPVADRPFRLSGEFEVDRQGIVYLKSVSGRVAQHRILRKGQIAQELSQRGYREVFSELFDPQGESPPQQLFAVYAPESTLALESPTSLK